MQAGRLARVLGRGVDAASDSNRIIDAYLDGSRYDIATRNTTTETGQRAADKAALPATTITGRAAGRIDDAAPNSGVGGARQIAGGVKALIFRFIKDESGSVTNPFVRQNAGNAVGGALNKTQLIDGLVKGGTKITIENVVDIRKINGKTVWLETGNKTAGLEYIYKHADEFAGKGITKSQIPDALFTALEKGKVVGHQGKETGRPIYEFNYGGKTHNWAITVSDNGFIVGANPK